MKKIAIFQVDFGLGGIQKALYNLLCSDILAKEKVDLYLFNKNNFYDIHSLPANINIIYLSHFPFCFKFIPFEFVKYKKISGLNLEKDYDIAIDFSGYSQE